MTVTFMMCRGIQVSLLPLPLPLPLPSFLLRDEFWYCYSSNVSSLILIKCHLNVPGLWYVFESICGSFISSSFLFGLHYDKASFHITGSTGL